MKRTSSIKLKAIFLLVVFLLNTVITFACSVGLEMSFNAHHHKGEINGKPHNHGESHQQAEVIFKPEPKPSHHHAGDSAKPREHSKESAVGLATEHKTTHSPGNLTDEHHKAGSPDDNCCKDEANKFAQADKIAQKSANLKMAPAFFPLFIIANNIGSTGNLRSCLVNRKYFVRGHHPPIANIRIAIRSFQI